MSLDLTLIDLVLLETRARLGLGRCHEQFPTCSNWHLLWWLSPGGWVWRPSRIVWGGKRSSPSWTLLRADPAAPCWRQSCTSSSRSSHCSHSVPPSYPPLGESFPRQKILKQEHQLLYNPLSLHTWKWWNLARKNLDLSLCPPTYITRYTMSLLEKKNVCGSFIFISYWLISHAILSINWSRHN